MEPSNGITLKGKSSSRKILKSPYLIPWFRMATSLVYTWPSATIVPRSHVPFIARIDLGAYLKRVIKIYYFFLIRFSRSLSNYWLKKLTIKEVFQRNCHQFLQLHDLHNLLLCYWNIPPVQQVQAQEQGTFHYLCFEYKNSKQSKNIHH